MLKKHIPNKIKSNIDKNGKKAKRIRAKKLRQLKFVKIALKTYFNLGPSFKRFKSFFNPLKENPKNYYRIAIKVVPNNIFCVFLHGERVLKKVSAGCYKTKDQKKLNVTRKGHRFQIKLVVDNFIQDLKEMQKTKKIILNKPIVVSIFAAPIAKRSILYELRKQFLRKTSNGLLVAIKATKIFNGCRARKQIKKKRRSHRIFK